MDLAEKLSEQLVETETGCWEYTGGRTGSNYGVVCFGHTKQRGAHVISYELTFGPVPKGMQVCHRCDNPPCCNPDHLFLGTPQDNKNDEIAKGRHVYGERVGNHKLTESDVIEIRKLIEAGHSLKGIGLLYGVTGEAIWAIKNRKNWAWL